MPYEIALKTLNIASKETNFYNKSRIWWIACTSISELNVRFIIIIIIIIIMQCRQSFPTGYKDVMTGLVYGF